MSEYYLLTFNEDWADEHNVPALACMTEEQYEKWKAKDITVDDGIIRAHLGNGGECFEEKFEKYKTAGELVTARIVKVTKVSEEFHKTFHKANLDTLSLSNVFD